MHSLYSVRDENHERINLDPSHTPFNRTMVERKETLINRQLKDFIRYL